eukprot:SAG31_NODE_27283_length_428_cov_1.145897_1_plen_76_part_01
MGSVVVGTTPCSRGWRVSSAASVTVLAEPVRRPYVSHVRLNGHSKSLRCNGTIDEWGNMQMDMGDGSEDYGMGQLV